MMILVIGGSFQGKKEYVMKNFQIEEKDICNLEKEELDIKKKCLYHFELLFKNPDFHYENIKDKLKDKIIIMDDLFCGVVPIDKQMRMYRERVGLVTQELAKEADHVIRIYLGLEQILK